MSESDLVNGTIQMLIGGLILKCMDDGGFVQAIRIAQIKMKLERKRKQRNPRAYVMWSIKQSCKDYVEYGENDRQIPYIRRSVISNRDNPKTKWHHDKKKCVTYRNP